MQGLRWYCAARPQEHQPDSDALAHWLGDSQRVEPVALAPLLAPQVAELLDSLALPATLRHRAGSAAALAGLERATLLPLALRLARELPLGMMAGVHPPEAWEMLARALLQTGREAAAQRCLRQAQAWLDLVTLPDSSPCARETFLQALPTHRAHQAAARPRR